MNDDLISRQAAIDLIDEYMDKSIELHYLPTGEGIKTLIFALPSAQQWIPCKERLPERGVSVLISHVGYVSEDFLDVDDGTLFFWNSGLDLEEERQNIAWMPLPEPWKGEER